MKTSYIFKIILLTLPVILLIYIFLIRDRIGADGIGGGGYDLTKMYTLIAVGLYLLILNIVLLIQGGRENRLLLLVGTITLIWTIIAAVRSF